MRTVVIRTKDEESRWIDEPTLSRIEADHEGGLTSVEILDLFAVHGVHLSESTLRKYVQHGLLPRSVRVGRKGKHQGSQGVYPVTVVRQILRIKRMMANDYTIEQIKKDVLFMRGDILQLESTLGSIFSTLQGVLKARKGETHVRSVQRDVTEAKHLGRELLQRLIAVESRLVEAPNVSRASAS
jgi:DNA-binding transcriptional MerR regulator